MIFSSLGGEVPGEPGPKPDDPLVEGAPSCQEVPEPGTAPEDWQDHRPRAKSCDALPPVLVSNCFQCSTYCTQIPLCASYCVDYGAQGYYCECVFEQN